MNPLRIAVIGATARSGRVIIAQALDAGYEVVGLARTPSKLGVEHPNLTLVKELAPRLVWFRNSAVHLKSSPVAIRRSPPS